MPRSKMEGKPTPRPGLRKNDMSPPSGDIETSPSQFGMEDDLFVAEKSQADSNDAVDNETPKRSPRLYPDIPLPNSWDEFPLSENWSLPNLDAFSPNDIYRGSYSKCQSRTGPQSQREKAKGNSEIGSLESEAHSKNQSKTEPQSLKKEPGKKARHVSVNRNYWQQNRYNILFMTLLVIVIIFYVISLRDKSFENSEQQTKPIQRIKPIKEVHEDFRRELKSMIQQFSQPRNFWVQLIGQIDSIMVDSPTQPAVILAVVPEDARGTAVCLLHKIARAIMYAFEDSRFVMYDVSDGRHNHHSLKLEIDKALQGLNEAHAAIIHNIENIPGDVALIFHAYCDNENAPYKQALLLPVIEVQDYYEDLAFDRLDNRVDDLLTEVWGTELKIKDVSALISRVANSPVLIQPEGKEKIRELCPI